MSEPTHFALSVLQMNLTEVDNAINAGARSQLDLVRCARELVEGIAILKAGLKIPAVPQLSSNVVSLDSYRRKR